MCNFGGYETDVSMWCFAVTCPPLSAPENGAIVTCIHEGANITTTSQQPFGSSCEVECDMGFALLGTETRTCLGDGMWDGTRGTCEGEDFAYLHVLLFPDGKKPQQF